MQDYFLVLLATVLLAVDFVFNKLIQKNMKSMPEDGLRYNVLLGMVTAIIFFAINGFHFEISAASAILAGVMALLVLVYNIIGLKILSLNTMTLYTLFLMTGGMTVPYIWGLIFWNENLTLFRVVGLIVMIGAVIIANLQKEKVHRLGLILCISVFFLNGFVSVISKQHQTLTGFTTVSTAAFVMLVGIAKSVFSGAALLFFPKKESVKPNIKSIAVISVCSAFVGGISYMLQLLGAKNLPATVLYPLVTGGCMVFTALAGLIVFGEKPSRKTWVGLGLCVLGTFMFL